MIDPISIGIIASSIFNGFSALVMFLMKQLDKKQLKSILDSHNSVKDDTKSLLSLLQLSPTNSQFSKLNVNEPIDNTDNEAIPIPQQIPIPPPQIQTKTLPKNDNSFNVGRYIIKKTT